MWAATKLGGGAPDSDDPNLVAVPPATGPERRAEMALDEIKIGGLGASRRRVEDNRFIRGKGNYITTSPCPECCTWRSSAAPWRTLESSPSMSAAPGRSRVRLVLTGDMLAARNLA